MIHKLYSDTRHSASPHYFPLPIIGPLAWLKKEKKKKKCGVWSMRWKSSFPPSSHIFQRAACNCWGIIMSVNSIHEQMLSQGNVFLAFTPTRKRAVCLARKTAADCQWHLLQNISFSRQEARECFIYCNKPLHYQEKVQIFIFSLSPHIKIWRGLTLMCANLRETDSHYVCFIYLSPGIDRSRGITTQD